MNDGRTSGVRGLEAASSQPFRQSIPAHSRPTGPQRGALPTDRRDISFY